MNKAYQSIREYYDVQQNLAPPRVHFNNLLQLFSQTEKEQWLDHLFYTNPRPAVNPQNYKFPSTFIGNQGLYNAVRYLYSSSSRHSQLVDDRGLWLDPTYHPLILENLTLEEGLRFRQKHKIDETATVFFASPGSSLAEAKLFSKTIIDGAKLLIQKVTSSEKLSESNFCIIISTPPSGLDNQPDYEVQSYLESQDYPCRVIFVSPGDEKFSAMSVSIDF